MEVHMKTVAFHTLGCKVNQVETEQIKDELISNGYQVIDFSQPADLYIINTCTVTHVSDRKSRAVIRRALKNNPEATVVVTGCMAELEAEKIARP
jgi:threonylcarbamoyladenosine tRNA methylthiotransferase MtaB